MALTKQEVFDKVATHLLTQMEQSRSEAAKGFSKEPTGCAYRGDGGKMCAVGCLIPDDIYDEEMEGKISYSLFYDFYKFRELFDTSVPATEITALLSALQKIHDCSNPSAWLRELEDEAIYRGLDTIALSKFRK